MSKVVGNYELIAQLATGGMAETHVARSLINGSIVVIKLLLPRYAGNAEFIEMFVDEGRVISSLRHENIVGMREFGFHNELPYLAMEYLHGVDLRTLTRTLVLRKKQHMPVDVALFVAMEMCAGLHHAHDARTIDGKPMEITHRDVSPQNVVVTFDGAVKLIDFGIATARGRTHETRSGALKGKIPYMAPEQVRAAATDRRTDVYATGIVLYEMLTARRPYIGKRAKLGEFSLMMAIVNHEIAPIETIRDVPPAIAKLVMKALALDANRRFQTAEEMARELARVATELGVVVSSQRLAALMNDVIGQRRATAEPATKQHVIELVSAVEEARTRVDEGQDPMMVEAAEVSRHDNTGRASVTDRAAPAFEDVIGEYESDRSSPAVDKIVEANLTRLRFHRAIEPGFRWGRLFDGIEGIVEIDFTGVLELTSLSVVAARDAMLGLGTEVSEIRLIAVPISLAIELEDRCRVVSVSCRGRCPSCETWHSAILAYDELRERLAAGSDLPCPRCGTGLVDMELGGPVRPSGTQGAVGLRSSIRMLVAAPTITLPMPAVVAPPRSRSSRVLPVQPRRWGKLYAGVAAGAVLAMVVVLGLKVRSRSAPSTGPAVPAAGSVKGEWVTSLEGDGPNETEAIARLRMRATQLVIDEIEAQLPEAIKVWRSESGERAVMNLTDHPNARIELEQIADGWEPRARRAKASYRLSPEAMARLRTYYNATRTVWGVELAHAPPSRPRGVIVVAAPKTAAMVAGDRVVSAGGQAVVDLSSIPTSVAAGTVELEVEHHERRTVSVKGGL